MSSPPCLQVALLTLYPIASVIWSDGVVSCRFSEPTHYRSDLLCISKAQSRIRLLGSHPEAAFWHQRNLGANLVHGVQTEPPESRRLLHL